MINTLAIINLIGAAQGFFMVIHFLLKRNNERLLNIIISVLVFSFAFNTLNTFFILSNEDFLKDFIQNLANNLLLLPGPCLLLYITIRDVGDLSFKKIYLHFLPFVFFMAWDLQSFVISENISNILMLLGFIQMGVYIFYSVKYLLKNFNKNAVYYSWAKHVMGWFIATYIINILLILVSTSVYYIPIEYRLNVTLLMAVPIFIIAYKEMNPVVAESEKVKKYESNSLSDIEVQNYLVKIIKAMEEDHYYRNPDLTIQLLAKKVNIRSRFISQVINEKKDQNFSEFVNNYRIACVKKLLVDPGKQNLTILGLAEEAGFKSGGRFNTLFKKATGTTPSVYKQKHLQKNV